MKGLFIASLLTAVLTGGLLTLHGSERPPAWDGGPERPTPGTRAGAPPAVVASLWRLPLVRRALRLFVLVCLVLVVVSAILIFFERRLIYFPTRDPVTSWRPAGLAVEECWFRTHDGLRLYGWWHPGQGGGELAQRPVLLWCHGNAGNISHREENLRLLAEHGLAVFIFDYRGYGRSEGTPSEDGLYLDAGAAYTYLVAERGVRPERVVCFGRSLGAAVALHLALEEKVAGLIMESPFQSVPAMARRQFPILPAWLLVRARFDNIRCVRGLAVPLLVVHGSQDDLVPIAQGRAVFDAAPEPKEFYVIEGAGHNDTYVVGGEEYFRRVVGFCSRCVAQAGGSGP
jgi:hypothetical protein